MGFALRRWKVLAVAAVLVVLVSATVVVLRPQPLERVSRQTMNYIRQGMSRADIEAILGRPGGFTEAREHEHVFLDRERWTNSGSVRHGGARPDLAVA
jgi:hypothetical protein